MLLGVDCWTLEASSLQSRRRRLLVGSKVKLWAPGPSGGVKADWWAPQPSGGRRRRVVRSGVEWLVSETGGGRPVPDLGYASNIWLPFGFQKNFILYQFISFRYD